MNTKIEPPRATKQKIDNSKRLADSGYHIVHIDNQHGAPGKPLAMRSMTVAYRPINYGRTYEIAVATLHTKDTFSKKEGTKAALDAVDNGQVILIPVDPNKKPATQFWDMFGNIWACRW